MHHYARDWILCQIVHCWKGHSGYISENFKEEIFQKIRPEDITSQVCNPSCLTEFPLSPVIKVSIHALVDKVCTKSPTIDYRLGSFLLDTKVIILQSSEGVKCQRMIGAKKE